MRRPNLIARGAQPVVQAFARNQCMVGWEEKMGHGPARRSIRPQVPRADRLVSNRLPRGRCSVPWRGRHAEPVRPFRITHTHLNSERGNKEAARGAVPGGRGIWASRYGKSSPRGKLAKLMTGSLARRVAACLLGTKSSGRGSTVPPGVGQHHVMLQGRKGASRLVKGF